MKCNHCGKEIPNDSNFCEFCGKKVKKKMPVWAVLLIVLGCVVVLGLGMVTGLLISENSDSKEKPAPEPEVDTLVEAPVYEDTIMCVPVAEEPTLAAQENGNDIGKKVTEPSTSQQTTTSSTTKAKVVPQGYVDLGLPSGTLWKDRNESGFYDYDAAVGSFGSKLPTMEQLQELTNVCTWEWTGSGSNVTGPNGNKIYLPAAGFRYCNDSVSHVGTYGFYWSSTLTGSNLACLMQFDRSGSYVFDVAFIIARPEEGAVYFESCYRCLGQSVRLVQNEH